MNNTKSFLKHFTVIGFGTFLNMLIGLLTTPVITRLVDPVEYGQLSIFTMYTTIAVMVLCLGLDQALVRFYYYDDSINYKATLLHRCVILPVIVSLAMFLVVIILIETGIYTFEFANNIVILLGINILVQLVYRFSLLLVRLSYNSKLYSALQILQKSTYVIIALILIKCIDREYFAILAFATTISFAMCLFISVVSQKKIWLSGKGRCCVSVSMKSLLIYGYPFIFSMGITTFFQAIDKMALNYFCTYTEVGIYSSTMSIVHIFSLVQTTFNTLWAPMAMEHYTKNKEDRSFYLKGNKIITVVMFFIGISLILCKDVFALLLGEKYREAAYILPFLIFNPIMYTISETTVSGLTFAKKSGMQVVVAVGACITNLVGNVILVPKFGCQGAAISTGLSYIVFFTLRTFLSNHYFHVNFPLKRFYLLTLVVIVYAFYNTFIYFNFGSIMGYFICLAVLICLYKDTFVQIINIAISILKGLKSK